jgi:hypothetical protein
MFSMKRRHPLPAPFRTPLPALVPTLLLALAIVAAPSPVYAQDAPAGTPPGFGEGYADYDELTERLQSLAGSRLASLESIGQSDAGRDLWLLTIGNESTGSLDQKPALLIVANLEGNHLVGSMTALYTAAHLVAAYGEDDAVTRLLDTRTVYVVPRANPDGAELVWSNAGYELPYKPHPSDPALGGMNHREIGSDLNGDGLVTRMRVRDPEGEYMVDPDDPRLMRKADPVKQERGEYAVWVEGIDPAEMERYLAAGSDGVNLNRNFPHDYVPYAPHVGVNQVSEAETRALADFAFDRTNIAAVLTFSPYDNLRSAHPASAGRAEGTFAGPPNVPTNLLASDRPYFEFVSERFREMTGLSGAGAEGEAGSWPQFAYYMLGLPSFTTPVWTPPEAAETEAPRARTAAGGSTADHRWLAHFDAAGIDGFVEWTEARHPTLGAVEVGGFVPNSRVNPPEDRLAELARPHADFAVWLGAQTPEVQVVETAVEARGDGIYLVTTTLENSGYFPTRLEMGQRARMNTPLSVRLLPASGVTILTGNPQEQISRMGGMGSRSAVTWLVQGASGTRLTLEVSGERAGGLQSATVTLR